MSDWNMDLRTWVLSAAAHGWVMIQPRSAVEEEYV